MLQQAATWLRAYKNWLGKVPQATHLMFAARTSFGRATKIFLFGLGVLLPLGSLIWLLLYWHGSELRTVTPPDQATGCR